MGNSQRAPIGRDLHDPLSQNLFRLLGRTRDYDFLDHRRLHEPRFYLDIPGLGPRAPESVAATQPDGSTRFFEDETSIVKLLADPEHHRRAHATWFDGTRHLDQNALQLVARGHLDAAADLWLEDGEPISRHNLAILYYAQLLGNPSQDEYWHNVLHCWTLQAERTNDEAYLEEVTVLCRQLEETAFEASRTHRPSVIRRCFNLLQSAYSLDEIDRLQEKVLGDDYCRLELACAEVRLQIADFYADALTMETAQNIINERILSVTRILIEASLPGSEFNQRCRHQVGAVLQGAARAWQSLGNPARQISSLEFAADMCIGGEEKALRTEIARLKNQQLNPEVTVTPLEVPRKVANYQVLIGFLILALVGTGFFFVPSPSFSSPTRAALQTKMNQLLKENDRLLNEIRGKKLQDPQRAELVAKQQKLLQELSKVEQALRRQ